MSEEYYMNLALSMARKGFNKDDVPVGAVIVYKDKVIAKAYNTKNIKKCAINHAEVLAIKKACSKLHSWHLEDCTLYVTMEPCLMCCGAIIQSRIKRVVYGASCEKFGYSCEVLNSKKNNHRVDITGGVLVDDCSLILKRFFSNKRG